MKNKVKFLNHTVKVGINLDPTGEFTKPLMFSPKSQDTTLRVGRTIYHMREDYNGEGGLIFYPPCSQEIANALLTKQQRDISPETAMFYKVNSFFEQYQTGTELIALAKYLFNGLTLNNYFKPEISTGVRSRLDPDLNIDTETFSIDKTSFLLLGDR